MSFTVAILGRPNVGKSTLFNRLVGGGKALVDNRPGVTRDRREAAGRIGDLHFLVIDTAGLEEATGESLEARMREQTERALIDADVALMLIDARAGVTPVDQHFADWLRHQNTSVILVANKCEGRGGEGLYEAFTLGLGDPIPISAEHGEGMADLFEALLPFETATTESADDWDGEAPEDAEDVEEAEEGAEPGPLRIAIVGRPNVGKSTLANQLLGEERLLTGPEPGITRDAIAVDWEYGGRPLRLVDTAGLRKKAKVTDRIERMSAEDTRRAIRLAAIVALVIDARDGIERQELTIAAMAIEEGRALVIAANKWDATKDRRAATGQIKDALTRSLPQARGVPVVNISALKGDKLDALMAAVFAAEKVWNRRITTGELNRWLAAMVAHHPPPMVKGRPNRLRYITQIKSRPPTFALWAGRPKELPDQYLAYLTNSLRETFDLPGTPIRVLPRTSKNPYAKHEKKEKKTGKTRKKTKVGKEKRKPRPRKAAR